MPVVLEPRAGGRRPPWLALAAIAVGAAFAAGRGAALLPAVFGAATPVGVRLLLAVEWLVEAVFALGIAGTTALALAYLLLPRRPPPAPPAAAPVSGGAAPPRVAVLYLCCGDFDRAALDSLRRLRHDGPLELWIHDDLPGGDPAVDMVLAAEPGPLLPLHLLRRPAKTGSKPGAINYVLERIGARADFVLLCDNDSLALDAHCLRPLLAPMADPRVAVVQARNVPVGDVAQCAVNRVASRAVDVFDLFLTVGSRFGWLPFVGHNALLRVDAVTAVGGLRPGCFADDIDLTLRLQTAGYRVHYAREVELGERHPPNYAAFRKRAYKWACGSTQVLREWLLPVLRSRHFALAEKWGFVQFLGFFALQALALAYTATTFLLAPFVLSRDWFTAAGALVAGTALPLLIFLPVLAYAARRLWWRGLPAFLATCWLCYGAADFPTARGVLHGLSRRTRRWVPTNSVRGGADQSMFAEALFGAAVLLVPLGCFPELLLSPLTFLIAAKFLLLPTVGELYQDGVAATRPARARLPALRHLLRGVGALLVAGLLQGQVPATSDKGSVVVAGDRLLVDGEPFAVRGVHYGPWRPGTGPGRSPYPGRAEIAPDLDLVQQLHANALLVFEPTRELLDVAWERHLRVLVGFWLEWPQFGTAPFAAAEDRAVAAVAALRDHPAVLGWVLGNEIPSWVVAQQTPSVVERRLRELHARVRAADPRHPTTHANWPVTRSLDLSFFEICAFNLYALWPPEVVARGYGNFVEQVLRPLAGGRPLLLTEFGTNALEAGEDGQARLDADCWRGLRKAGAIGGFAFEFADEWWKNYSNPKFEGAWWDRDTDLDDHLRHDRDPEEYYGLFTGERQPRPASAAIAAAYAVDAGAAPPAAIAQPAEPWRPGPGGLVGATIGGAALLFLLARGRRAAAGVDRQSPPKVP